VWVQDQPQFDVDHGDDPKEDPDPGGNPVGEVCVGFGRLPQPGEQQDVNDLDDPDPGAAVCTAVRAAARPQEIICSGDGFAAVQAEGWSRTPVDRQDVGEVIH
jgi:hypothetical protein